MHSLTSDKSFPSRCIVNYPKRGPGREVDPLGGQGRRIDRLSSATFSSDAPIL